MMNGEVEVPTSPRMLSAMTPPRPLASTPFATAVMPPIINTVFQLMLANICFWFRQPVSTEARPPMAAQMYMGQAGELTTMPTTVATRMTPETIIFPVNLSGRSLALAASTASGLTKVSGRSLFMKSSSRTK